MNKIKQFFSDISDSELVELIEELKESDENGFIGDKVRELARKMSVLTNSLTTTDFLMVQLGIMKEASFRWVNKLSKSN